MAAPLIIRDQRDRADQQEVVVMLADFSFTPPEQIFEDLQKGEADGGHGGGAPAATPKPERRWPRCRCRRQEPAAAPDLNDVKYDAFLANDRTLADPEVVKVEPGGRVLLRIINSSSMSAFHIDLGELDGELIAVDGFAVAPIRARSFPIAVAQRLDIRVALPRGPAPIRCSPNWKASADRTGIVLVAGNGAGRPRSAIRPTASPALTLDLERRLRAASPSRRARRIASTRST